MKKVSIVLCTMIFLVIACNKEVAKTGYRPAIMKDQPERNRIYHHTAGSHLRRFYRKLFYLTISTTRVY